MNPFSYPEAGADGTEEPSCGPTAPGERNHSEVLNKRVGLSGRAGRTSGLESDVPPWLEGLEVHAGSF